MRPCHPPIYILWLALLSSWSSTCRRNPALLPLFSQLPESIWNPVQPRKYFSRTGYTFSHPGTQPAVSFIFRCQWANVQAPFRISENGITFPAKYLDCIWHFCVRIFDVSEVVMLVCPPMFICACVYAGACVKARGCRWVSGELTVPGAHQPSQTS